MTAAQLPAWWPDWRGQDLVIIASGPSAKDAPVHLARGRARVIAINTSWKLAPWADILYACDFRWWQLTQGWQEFQGRKLTIDRRAADIYGLDYLHCRKPDDRVVLEPKGTVGWGGNSGFHCLNLALQLGVRRVLLVGYDMRIDHGLHWHGAHGNGLHNPKPANVARWRHNVDQIGKAAQAEGIEVINCSAVSTLTAYPKLPLAAALGVAA